MEKRFVAIWFRHLKTDWMCRHHRELKETPFVLALPDHGRMVITEANSKAKAEGLQPGMVVADARVLVPNIDIKDDQTDLAERLLTKLAHWCIRYTPCLAIDLPDGLLLDVSGCSHLWGSEEAYLRSLLDRLKGFGYSVRVAMADTIGTAWAIARYGKVKAIIPTKEHPEALKLLPPIALRLEAGICQRLYKLGLYQIQSFMDMPRSVLRRRFGKSLLLQLDYALGTKEEFILPVQPTEPYLERLPCVEPISTRKGIEIALQTLLEALCGRLQKEGKGVRIALFRGYRVDDKKEEISIRTNHASHNSGHLFKLFDIKIGTIEPALGIELFTLEAKVEDVTTLQETFWTVNSSLESKELAELLDGLQSKFGNGVVHRYLPHEHHLPEHSVRLAHSLDELPQTSWRVDKWRPINILQKPEPIDVMAPIPDYPPMNFRYKNRLYHVAKADACERIEPEWWLEEGLHRDYYIVEDEEGKRYWIFRLGHYETEVTPLWFIHGFFE